MVSIGNGQSADDGSGATTRKSGIVIVDHGSRRDESNAMLEEVARLFGERFRERFEIVEPAHMELAEPSIAAACPAKRTGRSRSFRR